jgi:hypothetical protein
MGKGGVGIPAHGHEPQAADQPSQDRLESIESMKAEATDNANFNDAGTDESLIETCVPRHPDAVPNREWTLAANALAASRRTSRLLWVGLILSLTANALVPIFIVHALSRPEKVALMDGTESLIIAPLVPIEESTEIHETICYWAAKAFLDRGPQGFDAPEVLDRVYLPAAAAKARNEFTGLAQEFAKKNIHQKLEVGRIDFQNLEGGAILARVIGQLLVQAQVGEEKISQPDAVTLNLKLVRNPHLGRNKRYPYAVADYAFGQPEPLPVLKREDN